MKYRKPMKRRSSRGLFRRTAMKSNKRNRRRPMRGGYRI